MLIILSEKQLNPNRRTTERKKNARKHFLYRNRNGKVKYLTRKCIRNWFVHPLQKKKKD